MAQAVRYELNLGFREEFHTGKNLILLCNNEALPVRYLFLEQHSVQTPARIHFTPSSPVFTNMSAALKMGSLLFIDMEKHAKAEQFLNVVISPSRIDTTKPEFCLYMATLNSVRDLPG